MKKNTQMLSAMNKNAILNLLKEKGPFSRADIARELSLSFPAVSSNAKVLIEEGLVIEAGEADNALGRKATLLSFNADCSYVVGVDIGRYRVRAMCADMAGNIRSYHRVRTDAANIIAIVTEAIGEVARQAGVELEDVSAIGIGLPGLYDEKTKTLTLVPYTENWGEPHLFEAIQNRYPAARVVIENSVNLGGIGEHWQGCAQKHRNILYIEFGVGVGAAVIIDGKILRGVNGAAGELGYITLEKETLRREFSEVGSLEELFPSRQISNYIGGNDPQEVDMEAIMKQLRTTVPQERIDNLPNYFAMTLINAISILNPELVVISGKLGVALFCHYEQKIRDLLQAHVPFVPQIACTALGEKANVIGAIALASKEAFPSYSSYEFIEP